MPPKLTLPAVLSIAFLLTACGTSSVGTVDSSCKSFKPIAMSKKDTDDTKRQIIGHNRAFEAVCPGQGAPSEKRTAGNA